jgi:outer membrane receptor for ferrienterochelin and colicins
MRNKTIFHKKIFHRPLFALTGILLLTSVSLFASDPLFKGRVVSTSNNSPLPGANVVVLNTTTGTVTNSDGFFELSGNANSMEVSVSFVGFETDTVLLESSAFSEIRLKPEIRLTEFSVRGRSVGTHALRTKTIHTEQITRAELSKAACCTLAESFETNASVDVVQTDGVTGAKQIRMLGLAGKYVLISSEKFPSLRGVLSGFGLDYVPGSWIQSIQISKGTSSVTDGSESLTGQINYELIHPETGNALHVNGFANNENRFETNFYTANHLNDRLSTVIMTHTSNNNLKIDHNNDGFLDMPMINRLQFANKWTYDTENYKAHYTLEFLDENRRSGNEASFDIEADNTAYAIKTATRQYNFATKQGFILNPRYASSIAFLAKANQSELNGTFGNNRLDATEKYLYSGIVFISDIVNQRYKISSGINFVHKNREEAFAELNANVIENMLGSYAEFTYNPTHRLVLQAGIRGDYNSYFDKWLVTPRAHAKFEITEQLHVRGSMGKGYKMPYIITELMPYYASSRTINLPLNFELEESFNAGGSIIWYFPLFENSTLTVDYFRTDFQNMLLFDVDSDPNAITAKYITNNATSDAFQAEINTEPIRGFTVRGAYRYNNVTYSNNGVRTNLPLVSKTKALINLSYLTPLKKWQFDATMNHNGKGRMPQPDVINPLWDNEFQSFNTFNAQITRFLNRWEIYAGSENISNFKIKNPIIAASNPYGDNFDASMIWGPINGRSLYVGFRFNIDHFHHE